MAASEACWPSGRGTGVPGAGTRIPRVRAHDPAEAPVRGLARGQLVLPSTTGFCQGFCQESLVIFINNQQRPRPNKRRVAQEEARRVRTRRPNRSAPNKGRAPSKDASRL